MNVKMTGKELQESLAYFTGTEQYHRYGFFGRNVVLTDGVKHLAEKGECYWLLDVIVSYIPQLKKIMESDSRLAMSFWKLKKNETGKGYTVFCVADSGEEPVIKQEFSGGVIGPLSEIEEMDLWVNYDGETWVIYLPSEH